MKPKRKHWYLISRTECVICGAGVEYSERKYGRKPGPRKRHVQLPAFACNDHFL